MTHPYARPSRRESPIAAGAPGEVVTPELLREVFHVEADVVADPRSGVPLCIPHGLSKDGLVGSAARER
jgi:iron complex transport system ATP-binding protein